MQRLLSLAIIIITGIQQAAAQQFGGNPPSLKWQQINTDTVRVIFPAGMDAQGRRVADVVRYISRNNRGSIGPQQRKVNIVLQNQTLQSNAYVQLGPFRSEFFLTPPPSSNDVGAVNWIDQLAVHEFRHVLQNNNFRKGVSKVFYYLMGELGQAAVTNIAVPNWFWEGDAVVMETALSNQGRGRLPAFFNDFRALTLAGKRYSFMQIRNGSFRNYIPDHYATGYLMTSYGRRQYGQTFWKDVTDDAVRYKGLFYPFSQSLKRRTGRNAAAFFKAALADYSREWKRKQPADTLTPANGSVVNYKYVYAADSGSLIVSKRSYKKLAAFYEMRADGQEKKITTPGIGFDDYFSYRNGQLLWTESRYDVRWGWKEYSVVRVFDRATGRQRTLQHERRCFSPDLSFDGRMIVVATVTPAQQYQLKVLDAQTGAVLHALPNPENWYYTYPKFTPDNAYIISAVRDQQGRMGLIRQAVKDGTVTTLVPFGIGTIGISSVTAGDIYFTAAYADVDNVYAISFDGGSMRQITDRSNGVQHFALRGDRLVMSEFMAEGYKLLQQPLTPGTPFDPLENHHSAWLQPEFGEGGNILGKVPSGSYTIRKYPQTTRLLNFHSWLPEISDPDYGLFLHGENVLGTMQTNLGVRYNTNESSPSISGSLLYGGLFPYIRLGGDYRFDRYLFVNDTISLQWNELDWYGGLGLPLNFTSGKYYRYLTLNANYHQVNRANRSGSKYIFRDRDFQYIDLNATFTNQRIRAVQHIFSHFAQTLQFRYNKAVNNVPAEQYYGRFDLYLPGFSANHSLVLQSAFQQADTMRRYSFTDNFIYARGYSKPFYERIWKLGVNYHFPICYPDWGFANLLFFNRLRGNIFYDHSMAYNFRARQDVTYASVGGEVYFDTKLGNVLPFTFGMRYSHLLNTNPGDPLRKDRVEVIVPLQQLFNY